MSEPPAGPLGYGEVHAARAAPQPQAMTARRWAPLIALVVLGALTWQLASVLLLLFGAVVVAALLRALADSLGRRTPLSPKLSLLVVVLLIGLLIGGAGWLFGLQITSQIDTILDRLPSAWAWIQAHLLASPAGRFVLNNVNPDAVLSSAGVFARVTAFANTGTGIIADGLLVMVGGLYLALDTGLYVRGFLALTPAPLRPSMARFLSESGRSLRLWLGGQFIAMVIIGVLTGGAMAAIHTPSALALGLFAGLTEFIPIVGPFLGAAPALLTALSVSPHQVLWTGIAFLAIQQIEGNAIQPLIQRHMVAVTPVVGLFALAAFSVLFGVLGLILAAPMTVILIVAIRVFYAPGAEGAHTEQTDPFSPAQG